MGIIDDKLIDEVINIPGVSIFDVHIIKQDTGIDDVLKFSEA